MDKILNLSEKTLVPLSLIGTLLLAATWVGRLNRDVEVQAKTIDAYEARMVARDERDIQILMRLTTIEANIKKLDNN